MLNKKKQSTPNCICEIKNILFNLRLKKEGCQNMATPELNNRNILLYHYSFGKNKFVAGIGYFNHVHAFCKRTL
jgi:hypothetical protein